MTDSSSNEKRGWFQRLKDGLSRSSSKLTTSITGIFTKRKLDRALLDELEEALIAADLGRLGQLRPAERVRFAAVSLEEADALHAAQEALIASLARLW